MAGQVSLSVPSIRVNNDIIAIVPNSFKYTPGDGETKVRAASAGGGNVESVHSEDAEAMISKITFSVYPTELNIRKIREWKSNIGANTVEALQRGRNGGKDFAIPFRNVSVTNDPEVAAAGDGTIEVQMAGDKVE
jgi:hypothetical protein